ncbi:MAG: phosphohistidine phosphatase SixA [Magnetovibrio sp.]|nr:phosphohistidine phosphatase SixA [Magnetovibrio sp.]
MRLYLMRHGKAGSGNVDELRELTERGVKDVRDVAAYLADMGLNICHVYHSTLVRARQTAELMASALHPDNMPLERLGVEPWGDVKAFVDLAGDWTEDTLVCGHEPFMGDAARMLQQESGYISVSTASVMAFERLPGEDAWTLKWFVNPKAIKHNTP